MIQENLLSVLSVPIEAAGVAWVLLGLMFGSFANVVIFRLPRMARSPRTHACALTGGLPDSAFNLCFPNSFCPACARRLRWYENVPLLSYLCLRGRCRHCKTAIPPRYPVVELLGALAGGLAVWRFGPTLAGLVACILLVSLVAAAWIDAEHRRLPDRLVLPLLALGAFVNLFGMLASPLDALVGGVLGYGLFWSAFWVHGLLTGRAAMGEGDFRLLAALGVWLGWQAVPFVVLAAMAGALTYGSAMIWRARRQGSRWNCATTFPFGPFLVMGAWGAVACRPFWNDMILCAGGWISF